MTKNELSYLDISTFCDSVAMMLNAGIQTDEAIALFREDSEEGALHAALVKIHASMEKGLTFASAVKATNLFPTYAVQMIEMSERMGRLELILKNLGSYYAQEQRLSQRLEDVLRYPAMIMGMMVLFLAVMLDWVLPVFTGVYDRLTGSVTASAYRYVLWARGLCWVALIAVVVLLGIVLLGSMMKKTKAGRETAGRWLGKLPVFGSIIKNTEICRFFSVFTLMRTSGTDEDAAMAEAREMVHHPAVLNKLTQCKTQMDKGSSFAQAAYEIKLLKPRYSRILLSGARSGSTAQALQQILTLLEQSCTQSLSDLLSTAEPLLSGVMLVATALSLVSVMLPLIGMMGTIG
ncbi:MAG: hypothetical protein GXW99_11770 [Clostridiales bacterium]|nr:hypothetical protein [Clostridiales bacterium]